MQAKTFLKISHLSLHFPGLTRRKRTWFIDMKMPFDSKTAVRMIVTVVALAKITAASVNNARKTGCRQTKHWIHLRAKSPYCTENSAALIFLSILAGLGPWDNSDQ